MITDKTQNANPDAQTIQPPAVMVYEISDPSVANEDFEILDQDVVHLGLKPFSARRVVESATLLIDEVLPQLPMRQWV